MSTFERTGIVRGDGRWQTAPLAAPTDRPTRSRISMFGLGRRWLGMFALLSLALAAVLYVLVPAASPRAGRARTDHLAQAGLLSLPPSAQGPVSAVLGAESAGYRLSAAAGGFRASSPAQHLRTSFTSAGASVSSGATRLGLRLQAVGYGSALTALGSVAPRLRSNQVVFAHPGVSEWYANGPLGLEQGFTLAKAPAGRAAGPLTLAVALSGNTQASLAEGGRTVVLRRAGKTVLRYTGLSASDARGHSLRSWLSLEGRRLLVHVDAAGARYPLRIDPFVQDGEKLTGSGESGEGRFGYSVALSAEGTTALIGGPGDNGFVGAAWVFTRSGSTWTQQGSKLTGTEESGGAGFGYSVALNAEGNFALIGAPYDHEDLGAAFVFTREGSTWSQQGEKLTGDAEGGKESGEGEFGYSVALSGNATTALIAGPFDDGFTGATWVFTRSESTWTQQGPKLTGTGGEDVASFGGSVALSENGETALIGGSVANSSSGAAWVFTRSGENWSQQGEELTSKEGFAFGESVALSASGDTALIGEPEDGSAGAAWLFTRSGSTWSHPGKKLATPSGAEFFGRSVSLDGEGETALVGGFEPVERSLAEGFPEEAWEFTRSGSKWSQQGSALFPAGESGEGYLDGGLALAADDGAAMLGLYNSPSTGAVWAFEPAVPPTVATGSVSEPTLKSALLEGTVNPNGATVSECKFEYGTTTAYGSSVPCSTSPGSGKAPVAVSATVSSLAEATTYHYRVSATNVGGSSAGSDQTFATLVNSKSETTENSKKSAEATDGPVSATASGGTGTVTVGQYGANSGGVKLFASPSEYVDVYQTTKSSFSKIEYKDCELDGANTLYWFNPHASGETGEWQKVTRQTYVPGSPDCIDAVAETSGTSPTVAQMSGTRYGGASTIGPPEFGRCVPAAKIAGTKLYEGFFTAKTCLEKGTDQPGRTAEQVRMGSKRARSATGAGGDPLHARGLLGEARNGGEGFQDHLHGRLRRRRVHRAQSDRRHCPQAHRLHAGRRRMYDGW